MLAVERKAMNHCYTSYPAIVFQVHVELSQKSFFFKYSGFTELVHITSSIHYKNRGKGEHLKLFTLTNTPGVIRHNCKLLSCLPRIIKIHA